MWDGKTLQMNLSVRLIAVALALEEKWRVLCELDAAYECFAKSSLRMTYNFSYADETYNFNYADEIQR